MIWTAWVASPGDRYPVELTGANANPPMKPTAMGNAADGTSIVMPPMALYPKYWFEAATELEAKDVFKTLLVHGISPLWITSKEKPAPAPKKMWRYGGTPHYTAVISREMGLPEMLKKKADACPDMASMNRSVSSLSATYHAIRQSRLGNTDAFTDREKIAVAGTLAHLAQSVKMFQCLAAASQWIVDEAADAHGVDRPVWTHTVMAIPPCPVTKTTTEEAIPAPTIPTSETLTEVSSVEDAPASIPTVSEPPKRHHPLPIRKHHGA